MSLFVKINMNVGMSKPLEFSPETILRSCVFYWGEYNCNYPFDHRGNKVNMCQQIEFNNIPVKDLQWVIDQMRLIENEKNEVLK